MPEWEMRAPKARRVASRQGYLAPVRTGAGSPETGWKKTRTTRTAKTAKTAKTERREMEKLGLERAVPTRYCLEGRREPRGPPGVATTALVPVASALRVITATAALTTTMTMEKGVVVSVAPTGSSLEKASGAGRKMVSQIQARSLVEDDAAPCEEVSTKVPGEHLLARRRGEHREARHRLGPSRWRRQGSHRPKRLASCRGG